MNIQELWKPIKGYKGVYEISNFGNIRRNGKILKQSTLKRGYKRVSLCKNNIKENGSVHRLVLSTFKENFYQKHCCNHIDCNPSNNHIDNLEWCTYAENEAHAFRNGKKVWNKGKIIKYSHRYAYLQRKITRRIKLTHCKNGHEYTKENKYISPDGFWHCRACHRIVQDRLNKRNSGLKINRIAKLTLEKEELTK